MYLAYATFATYFYQMPQQLLVPSMLYTWNLLSLCNVPLRETLQVMRRAHWDDEREVWVLERLSDVGKREVAVSGIKRPVSASGQRRPTSDFAKVANAMGDMNPRFKGENILNLELDMPERTTYDYEGPGVDSRVQVRKACLHSNT
jgi:kinesin family protein 3/17